MGRAIFQIDSDNKIRNIKGVDSHLENKENALVQLSGSDTMPITTDGKDYLESTHPINLMVQPGKKLDIRIRGTSPLEDIEIEADINAKMQHLGIKLPQIESLREYPYELSQRLGLPTKIVGSYDEFTSEYREENDQRKKNLHTIYGESYEEDLPEGLRPERVSEYFRRIGVIDSEEFKAFAERNNFTVNDFIEYVDKSYSLGQRYGQAVRRMESPFRISDLEYYVENSDISAIQDIAEFTEEMQGAEIAFENIFAKQMGTNIALMMNKGWMCENFVHRQDYSLTGEMCDDSYFDLTEKLKELAVRHKDDKGKYEAISNDYKRKFFSQIYLISSNIKILQDEMQMRGKQPEEIESVMMDFIESFAQNIDFKEMANTFGKKEQDIKEIFSNLIGVPRDYIKMMAGESRPDGMIYDEAILRAHQGNNVFYNELSHKLAERLQIDRSLISTKSDLLGSAIEATEETTRTGTINEQNRGIKELTTTEKAPVENAIELNE